MEGQSSDRAMSPRLPPEILDMILCLAYPSFETTRTRVYNPMAQMGGFRQIRKPHDERALVDLIRLAGPGWLPRFRSVLFDAPHVSTRQRADKLLKALELALPGDPASKGYIKKLVRHLSLDIRPHALADKIDRNGEYDLANGMTEHQISRLAGILNSSIESLVINTSEGGDHWLCGKFMLEALRRFGPSIVDLEMIGSALGCQNALHVFADSYPRLRSLKLKNLVPGWTTLTNLRDLNTAYANTRTLTVPYSAFTRLETLVLWDCTLGIDEFSDLLASLGPSPDSGTGETRFHIRHLTLHHLKARQAVPDQTARNIPFPPEILQAHLVPLVPHLESLHLVLYDRDPYYTRASGMANQLPAPTRPQEQDWRPGDAVAGLMGPNFRDLTLGGPYCVSDPTLFDQLDKSTNSASAAKTTIGPPRGLRRLKLTQCAERGNGEGITIAAFSSALDREWAQSSTLVEVDVEGMDPDIEDSDGEETPLWCGEALNSLVAKVERMNHDRARLASRNAGNSRTVGEISLSGTEGAGWEGAQFRLRVNELAREWEPRDAAKERKARARKPKRTGSGFVRGSGSPRKGSSRSKST
ncbi:hypothetical protein JCM10908_003372 [Rhodotorula pacifica]|uniref:uncharacterized protein n=1 Tax=Rhodotorula pacifica TaxID=1495444 RepID=UPI0031827E59